MKKLVLGILTLTLALFGSGKFVTYEVDGVEYEGYYSSPNKNAPLVYLVHDWDGLTDYEIKRASMLYDLGYATFAVDLFGKGVKPQTVEEKKKLTGALYKDREKMRKLLYAALEAAKKQNANIKNALGMGYCFGGTAILEFARSGASLKAFAPFHGGLKTPKGQDYSKIKGEIVVFHGSADTSVKIQDFAALVEELEKTGVKHEMITYSGAPHAFSVFGSQRYREDADKASWKRFTEVLEEKLK
eukprot:Anaeramoba_flamelloidesa10597_47.p1 GENE.a10597_47~~a10597_47.p1  ORF type:complete len:244 (+),score=23.49 a10597_47:169-900(+)